MRPCRIMRIVNVATLIVLGSAGAALAQQQAPPCANDIMPLRDETQKRAMAVKAASERKAPRPEVCKLISSFAQAEAQFAKYLVDNQTWCQIPDQALAQIKTNHQRTLDMRGKACASGPVGEAPAAKPAGPSLSDALGTSRTPVPGPAAPTNRGGPFDTMTGNVLQR